MIDNKGLRWVRICISLIQSYYDTLYEIDDNVRDMMDNDNRLDDIAQYNYMCMYGERIMDENMCMFLLSMCNLFETIMEEYKLSNDLFARIELMCANIRLLIERQDNYVVYYAWDAIHTLYGEA